MSKPFCNEWNNELQTPTHLPLVANEGQCGAWGRRRSADDWSYTLDGNDQALFADRGFTAHEHLPWFNLVNMNGRLYDPLVGRFLSADPYVQMPDGTQSYNRYSYCLNNPLRYTDYSGYTWGIFKPFVKFGKWVWNDALPAIDPIARFSDLMQWINDETPELRKKMADAGIPDFNIGGTVNLDGNVNVNASVNGHEVFNSANKDRSNAEQKVNKEIAQVRQDYAKAWHAASNGGDGERLVATGWGVEANAFIFGINAGWFTTGETGGLVVTFSSGLSNNLSLNVYGATVTSSKNDFKVNNLSGKGMEYSGGWGMPSYTRSSDNFDNPSYRIHQVSFGLGYFNKSGGISNTGTIVIPTLPVLIVEPRY